MALEVFYWDGGRIDGKTKRNWQNHDKDKERKEHCEKIEGSSQNPSEIFANQEKERYRFSN